MSKVFCGICGSETFEGLRVWYCDCNKKKEASKIKDSDIDATVDAVLEYNRCNHYEIKFKDRDAYRRFLNDALYGKSIMEDDDEDDEDIGIPFGGYVLKADMETDKTITSVEDCVESIFPGWKNGI